MDSFNEHGWTGQSIMYNFKDALKLVVNNHGVTFKSPPHDIARRLLNEIVEFEPMREEEIWIETRL